MHRVIDLRKGDLMKTRRTHRGLRVLIAAGTLAVVGVCAGAAVPDSAGADGSSSGSKNYCYPAAEPPTNELQGGVFVQECTITAPTGVCIQRSSEPVVRQECVFTQHSSAPEKRATAIQTHDPEGFDGLQDGTQVISVEQTNSSRRNLLDATQIADQCLGAGDRHEDHDGDRYDGDRDGDRDDDGRCEDENEEDGDDEERAEDRISLLLAGPIQQKQEAHQAIDGTQSALNSGKNEAKAFQSQHLHQRASNAPGTRQLQNTEPRANECTGLQDEVVNNACYTIEQSAVTGGNTSKLAQDYNLFQSARDIAAGQQRQGAFDPLEGGLEHGFSQTNSGTPPRGTPIQGALQKERLTQHRDETTAITWHQHGPVRKGAASFQANASNRGTAIDFQDSVLRSTGGGVGAQTDFLSLGCESSGRCTGFQHARTNNGEETNFASAPFIFMTITCGDVFPYPDLSVTENGPPPFCTRTTSTTPPSVD